MKTFFRNMIWGSVLVGSLLTACTPFDELNSDPTRLNEANPGSFIDPILYNISSYSWKRFNNFTFELMGNIISYREINGIGSYR